MSQSSATQRGSEQAGAQFNTDRTCPGRWTITFSNPGESQKRSEVKGSDKLRHRIELPIEIPPCDNGPIQKGNYSDG